MKKYGILVLVKHSEAFYMQSPEEEAKSQTEVNDFITSWRPVIEQTFGYHCCGLHEYDWFGLFEVDEVSYWEAFREEYNRRFHGRIIKREIVLGVSHQEFVKATERVSHYQKLRALNIFPGTAEVKNVQKDNDL